MRHKLIACTFILFFTNYIGLAQKKAINLITKEQKLYELSMVWKELSYNFANMDNCPGLDIDSLYRAFIPIIQNTENDFEYCKEMERFLAHFNNGRTDIYDIPRYLDPYIARPYIKTVYKDERVFIDNLGELQTKELQIGDEIVTINGMNAVDYFQKYYVPYICTSNEEHKIHKAMFNSGPAHLLLKDTRITLGIKTEKGTKKVDIYVDNGMASSTDAKKENWLVNNDHLHAKSNAFAIDIEKDFAYIRLMNCNQSFSDFFAKKYPLLLLVNNVIIDISHNSGGDNSYTTYAVNSLLNQDTIYRYKMTTRTHNAYGKGITGLGLYARPDFDIEEYSEQLIIQYYKGNAFEDISQFINSTDYENPVDSENRYKGNIYVIIGENTVSAGEGLAIELSQNKNITFLGKKTSGSLGNIYPICLPSGLVVTLNMTKTYDYQNNDVSSGIFPHYEYDFSEFYKTEDPDEMLGKFVEVIQEFETRKYYLQR